MIGGSFVSDTKALSAPTVSALQPIESEQNQASLFVAPNYAHASQSFQDASVPVSHNWLAFSTAS